MRCACATRREGGGANPCQTPVRWQHTGTCLKQRRRGSHAHAHSLHHAQQRVDATYDELLDCASSSDTATPGLCIPLRSEADRATSASTPATGDRVVGGSTDVQSCAWVERVWSALWLPRVLTGLMYDAYVDGSGGQRRKNGGLVGNPVRATTRAHAPPRHRGSTPPHHTHTHTHTRHHHARAHTHLHPHHPRQFAAPQPTHGAARPPSRT